MVTRGFRLRITEGHGPAGERMLLRTCRLYKHNGNVIGDLTYEYDAADQRTKMGGSFARSILPETVGAATYNAANQQLIFGGNTLTYDLNGNLTNDGTNTYTWNARNQMTQVTGPQVNASFGYGANGSRTSTTVNGTTTSFLRSGPNVVQEQSSQSGTTNIISGGPGEIFTGSHSSGVSSSIADALGNAVGMMDASGVMQTEYSYGSFGETTSTGATSSNSTQYGGSSNDGTGLQYNGSYYSPELRRFINEGSGGDNPYSIPGNGPTKASPSGPSSFLKNPFPVDHVLGNGISNTLNDLVMGDHFAEWAFILGDHCRPGWDRAWAGGKIIVVGGLMAGGGLIARGLMRGAGGLIKAGKKLLSGGKGAGSAADHIAIGIRAQGLEQTASQVGARHLLNDPNWRATLQAAIGNPNTKFTISLDGFSGSTPYSQLMGAAQRGLTPAARAT